jgi:hypothetical protein
MWLACGGNALIVENPFAFLLAVIFDQGIPAERAWRAPYDLMRRLGTRTPRGVHECSCPPLLRNPGRGAFRR